MLWCRVDARLAIFTIVASSLSVAVPAPTRAQGHSGGDSAVVRVQVVDSMGEPARAVEVSVLQGVRSVVAVRTTNDAGRATVVVAADSLGYEVVARRIGFARASRFVRAQAGDTVVVAITLVPLVQQLDEVRVSASDARRRSYYHLDAETIAGSDRPIRSALDAIAALRPDMFSSRGGWRVCGTMQEVWINGRRIPKNFVPDPMLRGRVLPGVSPRAPVSAQVLTILSRIRPEHIAEMNYIDCFGGAVRKLGSENALFVVLKPGVDYRWPHGTFVVDDSTDVIPPARR